MAHTGIDTEPEKYRNRYRNSISDICKAVGVQIYMEYVLDGMVSCILTTICSNQLTFKIVNNEYSVHMH